MKASPSNLILGALCAAVAFTAVDQADAGEKTRIAPPAVAPGAGGAPPARDPQGPTTTIAGVAPRVPKKGIAAQLVLERRVFAIVNRVRKARGKRPLARSLTLKRAARSHSAFQARRRTLTHDGPRGMRFDQRLARFGYPKRRRQSEIVGMSPGCTMREPAVIVRAWLNSPLHKKLMLDGRVRRMGVGAVSTARCTQTYFTIDFGG